MRPKRRREIDWKWKSHNRVLNGGNRSSGNARNPNFDTEETKLLISLWGDPKVQKALVTMPKKRPVIAQLVEQLRSYGYNRTIEEISTRIKNLKCFYNRYKRDMQEGLVAEPKWKYFRSMEKIMTRPIFSVRPNEVPKPSPRFRMEGANENSEVWSRRTTTSGAQDAAGSDDIEMDGWNGEYGDDDDELFTQEMLEAGVDCDIAELPAEVRKAMEGGIVEEVKSNEADAEIKKEPLDERDEEEGQAENGLLVPKQEPIDVDAVNKVKEKKDLKRDENGANEIFPKLSAYLQLSSNNASSASATNSSNKIITTIASGTSTTTNATEVNTSASNHPLKIAPKPMVLASHQQSQQGKISLVPTNILLKQPQQQQQMQLRPQPGQHIIYNPNLTGNSALGQQATTATMPNGMKVLLVNALPKSGVGSVAGVSDTQPKIITTNAMKSNCITSTVPTIGEARSRASDAKNQKANGAAANAGFRSMMTQLINVQTQKLEVSRQRLEIERQRLDFEKSIAERILAALPNLANIANLFAPQTAVPILTPAPVITPTTASAVADERTPTPTMPLLTPKIEKED